MTAGRRSGRRPGDSGSREAILESARSEFATRGFDGATVRGIAAGAGVDPALVHHFFGTKQGLFVAAMRLPFDPDEFVPRLLAPGVEGLGERLTAFVLQTWESEDGGEALLGMVRSAVTNERFAENLRAFMTERALLRIAEALDGPDAPVRAGLAVSQLFGLILARYVLRIGPLAALPRDEVVARVGPLVQAALAGSRRDGPLSHSRQT
jgi:AcrR family transcriptional regulator